MAYVEEALVYGRSSGLKIRYVMIFIRPSHNNSLPPFSRYLPLGWRRTTGWLNKGILITRQGLTEAAEQQFALLAHQNYLQDLQESAFTTQLAELWGEINVVHSFREGNTRTQSLFFNWQRKRVIHFHCID